MANIKSAKKRVKTSEVRRMRNISKINAMRTAIKKFDQAVQAGDKEQAQQAMAEAIKRIDKAGAQGLLHKNNVANKKSRIARAFNSMA